MKVTVELDENPSTGYRWQSDPAADESNYWSSNTDGEIRVGRGGLRQFTYTNMPDVVHLTYRRSFDPPETPPVDAIVMLRYKDQAP